MPVWFENEAPSTSRASLRPIVIDATGMPERPSTPHASGWSSGSRPLALNVVITGASSCSARAITCSRKGRAPLPAMIAGRSAPSRRATARASSSAGGAMAVAATRPAFGRAGGSSRPGRSCTSSGKIRWATSRFTSACFRARAMSSEALAAVSTVWLHSAPAEKASASGTSWKAPGPSTWVWTWPVRARIGTRSTLASHRPVSRLVAPGPAMVKHAAGRPVSLA